MSDKDKQPLAASASAQPEVETADAALQHIVDGFLHFHHEIFPQQEELFKKLATAQRPRAMFIACADSRIVPELITQSSRGHSDCGAMRAVLNPQSLEKMPTVKAWLRHAEVAKTMVQENCNCANESESMHVLTEENVIAQLQHLRTHPSVASRMANGQLFIHGWVYNIETSEIKAYDADQGCFLPLNGSLPIPVATPKARF